MRAETIEEQPKVTTVIEPGSFSSLPKDGKKNILSFVMYAHVFCVFCVCREWREISKVVTGIRFNDQLKERKDEWTSENDHKEETIFNELNFCEETVKHLLQKARNSPLRRDKINVLFCKWWWWWFQLTTLYDQMFMHLSKAGAHTKASMRFTTGIEILDRVFIGSIDSVEIFEDGLTKTTENMEKLLSAEQHSRPYFFVCTTNPNKNISVTMHHSGNGRIVKYGLHTAEGILKSCNMKVQAFLSGEIQAVDILLYDDNQIPPELYEFRDFLESVTGFEYLDDGY